MEAVDGLSTYRQSIDSYEYLLRNDRRRLAELASIFDGTRSIHTAASTIASSYRLHSGDSLSQSSLRGAISESHISVQSDVDALRLFRHRGQLGVEGQPRLSAAFLELSDSESDSSDTEDAISIDSYNDRRAGSYNSRPSRLAPNDRSLSKLSNFFGSTPSQIVRSQRRSSYAPSQPDALKTMLRSLEEEALDDVKLTTFQKSEVSRKVRLLRKRTTNLFS
jgi:hypothetical protein